MLNDALRAWLAHVKPLYPGGVPRSCLRPTAAAVNVAFLLDRAYGDDDPESVLLDAAITKGLKMTLQETARGAGEALPAAPVLMRLTGRRPDGWSRGPGGQAIVNTHRLSEICRDSAAKREFWEDLKAVLDYLGKQS